MKQIKAIVARLGIFGDLLHFMGTNKRWWLLPFLLVLGLFAVVIILGQATPLGPFVYMIF